MTREQSAALEWAISELNEIGVLGNEVRHMDELCRLRAALSAPKAEAVTVKPLEWKLSWGPYDDGDECHTAFTPFGSYSVKRIDGEWVWGFCFDEYYDEDEFDCADIKDGKRSAEAHWQDRCSDIVSASPVPAITDEAVERAVEAMYDLKPFHGLDNRPDPIPWPEYALANPELAETMHAKARAALLAAFPGKGEGE